MSCKWCVHWVSETPYYEDPDVGECRRFPKPEKTKQAYRCGEFVCRPDTTGGDLSLMHGFYVRMHQYADEARDERAKRIAAEKKLKAVRTKARQAPNKSVICAGTAADTSK
jgi:hypothetical protein